MKKRKGPQNLYVKAVVKAFYYAVMMVVPYFLGAIAIGIIFLLLGLADTVFFNGVVSNLIQLGVYFPFMLLESVIYDFPLAEMFANWQWQFGYVSTYMDMLTIHFRFFLGEFLYVGIGIASTLFMIFAPILLAKTYVKVTKER